MLVEPFIVQKLYFYSLTDIKWENITLKIFICNILNILDLKKKKTS